MTKPSLDPFGIIKPLHEYRQRMKRYPTPAEQFLKRHLKQCFGARDVSHQQTFGWYILDFVVRSRWAVIELDGSFHDDREDYDKRRDSWITSCGVFVLRFPNKTALETPGKIISEIKSLPIQGSFEKRLDAADKRYFYERDRALAARGLCLTESGELTTIMQRDYLAELQKKAVEAAQTKTEQVFTKSPREPRLPCPQCGIILARRWVCCRRCKWEIPGRKEQLAAKQQQEVPKWLQEIKFRNYLENR